MHALIEAGIGAKPALQPNTAIGPAVRAIAGNILAKARGALADPERTDEAAVHDFRRATKQWRALMRLLAPFVPDADRWRREARDHARSLAHARDGAAALNAYDGLIEKGVLVLSKRSNATVRGRIEALRASEEQAVLTPALRDAIIAWLDTAAAAIESWPLDPFDFSAIAAQLAAGYRAARRRIPDDWAAADAADLHTLRQRVVDLRYQMELIEPLWPRFGQMWIDEAERLRERLGRCQDLEVLKRLTAPHQPLARWRSRLTPACAERSTALVQRAARIAHRLFSERPKAFRHRLESLWEHAR
ncbi:MAG TPA: CHAD domain-containing protein [Xanthobacteraceae bacterium]|nr:CHAD domain-containing protein [Xanthobacteraceae bacterium]